MVEIDEMIEWYLSKGKGIQSIQILLDFQLKLSGHSYFLAQQVADEYANFAIAEQMRKVKTETLTLDYYENNPAGISRSKATRDVQGYKDQEISAEAEYKAKKLKLEQLNKILDGLMQRISYLKREQEKEER